MASDSQDEKEHGWRPVDGVDGVDGWRALCIPSFPITKPDQAAQDILVRHMAVHLHPFDPSVLETLWRQHAAQLPSRMKPCERLQWAFRSQVFLQSLFTDELRHLLRRVVDDLPSMQQFPTLSSWLAMRSEARRALIAETKAREFSFDFYPGLTPGTPSDNNFDSVNSMMTNFYRQNQQYARFATQPWWRCFELKDMTQFQSVFAAYEDVMSRDFNPFGGERTYAYTAIALFSSSQQYWGHIYAWHHSEKTSSHSKDQLVALGIRSVVQRILQGVSSYSEQRVDIAAMLLSGLVQFARKNRYDRVFIWKPSWRMPAKLEACGFTKVPGSRDYVLHFKADGTELTCAGEVKVILMELCCRGPGFAQRFPTTTTDVGQAWDRRYPGYDAPAPKVVDQYLDRYPEETADALIDQMLQDQAVSLTMPKWNVDILRLWSHRFPDTVPPYDQITGIMNGEINPTDDPDYEFGEPLTTEQAITIVASRPPYV